MAAEFQSIADRECMADGRDCSGAGGAACRRVEAGCWQLGTRRPDQRAGGTIPILRSGDYWPVAAPARGRDYRPFGNDRGWPAARPSNPS